MPSKEKDSINWNTLKRLFPFIKPYRLRLGPGILFGILYGATQFGLLAALGWATGIISGEDLSNAGGLTGGLQYDENGRLGLDQVIRAVAGELDNQNGILCRHTNQQYDTDLRIEIECHTKCQ